MTFNMLEIAVLSAVFLGIAGLTFLIINHAAASRRAMKERLKQQGPPDSGLALGYYPDMVLGEMTPAIAAQVPMSEEKKTELQKDLLAAGFYRKTALVEYGAIRAILTFAPLIGGLLWALLGEREQMLTAIFVGVVAAMAGFSLPRLYIVLRGKIRGRQIERALPVAVDMLVMCLSAGLNLLASIRRVRREMKNAHPVMATELEIVRMQADLSSLQLALQQFAERVQVPEVRNLAMILVQSERLGTDTSAALLEYSNNLRTNIRQRADAYANRTMFWMLIPTLLCLWIPAAIILIGPAVLELSQFRSASVREQWRSAREELRNINRDSVNAGRGIATPSPAAGMATEQNP
jgi:tight adherence protein C